MFTSVLKRSLLLRVKSTQIQSIRTLSSLSPSLYTAISTSKGSRASGSSSTLEGNVHTRMGLPKEMGGSQGPLEGMSNPEQLLGMAYSTCFLSALGATQGTLNPTLKPLPKTTTVRSLVSIGKKEGQTGFFLAIELEVVAQPLRDAGLDDKGISALLAAAHELCPYSKAMKGNVEIEVKLVEA